MPSGAIGLHRRLAVVLLCAASFVHPNAQVDSAGVGPDQRGPTANTLSQAATDNSWSEHANRQHHYDAEQHLERRISAGGLDPTTKCMEGQSFTVYSPRRPQFSGCYSGSNIGMMSRMSEQYVYYLFKDTAMVKNRSDIIQAAVLARTDLVSFPFQHARWVLGSMLKETADEDLMFCVSFSVADRSHHPADADWCCELPANGTGAATQAGAPDANDFHVSCGCSGGPRTAFDREADSTKGRRKDENFLEDRQHDQMLPNQKPYGLPAPAPSNDVDFWPVLYFSSAIIVLFLKLERIMQQRRISRLRASGSDGGEQTGTELTERVA